MKKQLTFKFPFKTSYEENDFYVSTNNFEAYKLIESWPKWSSKCLNIFGPKGCGKTHLINILKKKIKILYLKNDEIHKLNIKKIEEYECVVIDELNNFDDEKKFYTILNHLKQVNVCIICSSTKPINQLSIKLPDLKSRLNSFLYLGIDLPTDELLRVIMLKYFSDKQTKIDLKVLEYMIKNIERSYEYVFMVLKKIDEHSLSLGKPISINLVKKILENEQVSKS